MRRVVQVSAKKGFTLIELLVVVAIIALLISILLPSLSKAREQARTALCLSRVGQMTKAMLLYAEDYGETLPFVATGHYYPSLPDNDVPDPNERWLMDCITAAGGDPALARSLMRQIAYGSEENWPSSVKVPQSGLLFQYTRFENVYRCPEFERIRDPAKTHNAFNYTRAIWARRYRCQYEAQLDGISADAVGDVQGPIMKPSKIHNCAQMAMLLDEQWDRHVACNGQYPGGANYTSNPYHSPYVCNDYLFFLDNIIAVSHGSPTTSDLHSLDVVSNPMKSPHLWKRGGVGFYDGHAALMRDPWPTYELGKNKRSATNYPWRFGSAGPRIDDERYIVRIFVTSMCYWQRGFDPMQEWGKQFLTPPI